MYFRGLARDDLPGIPWCGSGLARDSGGAVLQGNRVDAIASKPAPTDGITPLSERKTPVAFWATGVLCVGLKLMGDR